MSDRRLRPGDLFQPDDPALVQLGRLSDGWGRRLRRDNPQHQLALDVARDLRAAGFELHDCARDAPTGGVCLLPISSDDGVIVTWAEHDVLVGGSASYGVYARVLETMNRALAEVLAAMGWWIEPLGVACIHVVRNRVTLSTEEVGSS